MRTSSYLVALFFGVVSNTQAGTVLEQQGCYRLSGLVAKLSPGRAVIVTRPGTVSSEPVIVQMPKNFSGELKEGDEASFEVAALAGTVRSQRQKIVFSKLLSRKSEKSPWSWMSPLGEGRCP